MDSIKGSLLKPGWVKISILLQLETVKDDVLKRLETVEADLNVFISELKSLEKESKKINTSEEEKRLVKVGSLKQGDTFGELALIS